MSELEKAMNFNLETREALRTVFNELNSGQQKKLMNNEKVKPIFARYGIKMERDV